MTAPNPDREKALIDDAHDTANAANDYLYCDPNNDCWAECCEVARSIREDSDD